jgi:hypothetical protein
MQKKSIIFIVIAICVLSMGAILETERFGWNKPRVAINTDDTLVTADANGMKFADIPTYSYQPNIKSNAIEVCWVMDDNGSSCVATLFAAREKGDIVKVWTGTITAGTQQSTSNEYYVDTIASTTETWLTDIIEVDGGGNNRMARIMLDTCGYKYFFFQYTGLSSETVRAYISGY